VEFAARPLLRNKRVCQRRASDPVRSCGLSTLNRGVGSYAAPRRFPHRSGRYRRPGERHQHRALDAPRERSADSASREGGRRSRPRRCAGAPTGLRPRRARQGMKHITPATLRYLDERYCADLGSLHESALSVRHVGRSMNGLCPGMSAAPLMAAARVAAGVRKPAQKRKLDQFIIQG
jgi:hypothetical protein